MNSFGNFFHLQDMSWPTILLRLRDTSYGHWLMKETCLLLSNWLVDLLLVLWPKQVINISGTSIVPVRIISINTEASATKDRVDSCFTEPSDSHTESHCNNTSNIPKRVVFCTHFCPYHYSCYGWGRRTIRRERLLVNRFVVHQCRGKTIKEFIM